MEATSESVTKTTARLDKEDIDFAIRDFVKRRGKLPENVVVWHVQFHVDKNGELTGADFEAESKSE